MSNQKPSLEDILDEYDSADSASGSRKKGDFETAKLLNSADKINSPKASFQNHDSFPDETARHIHCHDLLHRQIHNHNHMSS